MPSIHIPGVAWVFVAWLLVSLLAVAALGCAAAEPQPFAAPPTFGPTPMWADDGDPPFVIEPPWGELQGQVWEVCPNHTLIRPPPGSNQATVDCYYQCGINFWLCAIQHEGTEAGCVTCWAGTYTPCLGQCP